MPNTLDEARKATEEMFEEEARIKMSEEMDPPTTASSSLPLAGEAEMSGDAVENPSVAVGDTSPDRGNEVSAASGGKSEPRELPRSKAAGELFADSRLRAPQREDLSEALERRADVGIGPYGEGEATEITPHSADTSGALEEAVRAAEAAAQAAQQTNMQYNQALSELEALRQQNEQLRGTVDELSNQNRQNIVEEALTPPVLDVEALSFLDDAAVAAAQADYAARMNEYTRAQLMKELNPLINFAKEGIRERDKAEAMAALSQIPELAGIADMAPQLDNIIAKNKWLQAADMPEEERRMNAYAIARGVNAINTPPPEPQPEPTADKLMELYNSNPEFRQLVEKQRLSELKQSQQVPPLSASSGAVNAALNIKEKPKTFEEASQRTREMFGGV